MSGTILRRRDQTARPPRVEHYSSAVNTWLAGMLARKPRMLVAVALANRMARIVWVLLTKKESYRAPATA